MALPVSALITSNTVQLEGGTLRVRCEIVNRSSESWREDAGWAVGYQLFDEPTGTLVVDGERKPLRLAPSESRNIEMDIALPPEPGEYNIFISVMREHVAWFYNEGWPFLLVDILVDDNGEPRVLNQRIAD